MGREGVDHALAQLSEEKDRIAASLLDLEGTLLLRGVGLTGETERRAGELRDLIAGLWALYDPYSQVLDEAVRLRARSSRPGQEQLAELTRLLTGTSVEIPEAARRTLQGPAVEAMTLRAAVARMTPRYDEAAALVERAEALWSATGRRLEAVQAAFARAVTLDVSDPQLDRLRDRFEALEVHTDPLGRHPELDRLALEVPPLLELLREAAQVRTDYTDRTRRITDLLQEVAATRTAALDAARTVGQKIASPSLPTLTGPDLAGRLPALERLREQRRWRELAPALTELERDTAAALAQITRAHGQIQGLLDRRAELRGRLEAYRVKAKRLGIAENPDVARLYESAWELLWTSPCDLRPATVALAAYQKALSPKAAQA
ncbi:MAG: hypothetical protein ABIS86_08005 [Streptosporangiaceae bacterium]